MNPAQVQETQAQYGDCHRQHGDQSEQTLTELCPHLLCGT